MRLFHGARFVRKQIVTLNRSCIRKWDRSCICHLCVVSNKKKYVDILPLFCSFFLLFSSFYFQFEFFFLEMKKNATQCDGVNWYKLRKMGTSRLQLLVGWLASRANAHAFIARHFVQIERVGSVLQLPGCVNGKNLSSIRYIITISTSWTRLICCHVVSSKSNIFNRV